MGDLATMADPATEAVEPLTATEAAELAEAEETIEAGLQTYVSVGLALGRIAAERLYRASHPTFEAYLRQRWKLSRSYAYQLMHAATTVSAIADTTDLPLPTTEAQARELGRVPDADRAAVWAEVLERTNGQPTAAAIRQVRDDRISRERQETWAEASRRAGGLPDLEHIQQVRAERRAAQTTPPDRDQTPSIGDPTVATTGPAGADRPGGEDREEMAPAATTAAGAGPAVAEAACGRCSTMTPVDELATPAGTGDAAPVCPPCRTTPPDDYVTTLLPYCRLLPGDYLEHWRGADGDVLGFDLVSTVQIGAADGGAPVRILTNAGRLLVRRAADEVKARRVPGRTKASGGVSSCTTCCLQVPDVVTYNDRCPACITAEDQTAMQVAKLAAQASGMVPGPEQEMPAARVRAGDLIWAQWSKGSSGGVSWLPVTYVEIGAEPEGPGEWMVHARARTSAEHTGTIALTYYWDDLVRVRRPVPGTAAPAPLPAPEPAATAAAESAALVDTPAAVPVDGPAPKPAQPARPPLTVEQIGRLREAYRYARTAGWDHQIPTDPCHLSRSYYPARVVQGRNGDRVAKVDVCWDTDAREMEISYRSERGYHLYDNVVRVVDVDQALDVLAALGLLPAALSSAYTAGRAAGSGGAR